MSAIGVRALRDVRLADAREVGGKAAGLGDLLSNGWQVPDGVVVVNWSGASEAERTAALDAALRDLGPGPFAVRSSATAEDGIERSYAGMYESVLGVGAGVVAEAIDKVTASAAAPRVSDYDETADGNTAVIVQRLIEPVASGVALTADPIDGDRRACVVTAVRGRGERLVSGEALGDEWVVFDGAPKERRRSEGAIDRRRARMVARAARRIAAERGAPQDIEWAVDAAGVLWILQARPMTALPPEVSWASPARGAFSRTFRIGEWISGPVSPLFESWLLPVIEEEMDGSLRRWVGLATPAPHHVVVNGWCFYSLNWLSPRSILPSIPRMLVRFVRNPRRVAGATPATARFSVSTYERDWREDLLPRYRAAVARAEERVESLAPNELPALIDELATLAGEYFASIAALTGAAYKLEMSLATAYRHRLAKRLGGSHLPLLAGFAAPASLGRHAVVSLDWVFPTAAAEPAPFGTSEHSRVVADREAAERAAFEVLAGAPRRLRRFRRLLAEAQYLVPLREEQVGELTLPWPVMRRAVERIGEQLVVQGCIATASDAFAMTRDEVSEALRGGDPGVDTAARWLLLDEQARLVPPMMVGRLNPMTQRMWDRYPSRVGGARSRTAIVSGGAASAGRATGLVRVIRGPEEFGELQPGEILVAPVTAPAWTTLFTRAAAVVTDVGSAAAHASIIAREYGIPAVVGCGDATARLRTGMRVTVDGGTGNVEPAS